MLAGERGAAVESLDVKAAHGADAISGMVPGRTADAAAAPTAQAPADTHAGLQEHAAAPRGPPLRIEGAWLLNAFEELASIEVQHAAMEEAGIALTMSDFHDVNEARQYVTQLASGIGAPAPLGTGSAAASAAASAAHTLVRPRVTPAAEIPREARAAALRDAYRVFRNAEIEQQRLREQRDLAHRCSARYDTRERRAWTRMEEARAHLAELKALAPEADDPALAEADLSMTDIV